MSQDAWVDHYIILGLYDPDDDLGPGPDVTPKVLKKAWTHEQGKYHADIYPLGSARRRRNEERSKLINVAYDVLRDPVTKREYDREWYERRRQHKQKAHPEIIVTPSPSGEIEKWFSQGIPLGETREATFKVTARSGTGFRVRIQKPIPAWMEVEPDNGQPPFYVNVRVKTTGLRPGDEQQAVLVFLIEE